MWSLKCRQQQQQQQEQHLLAALQPAAVWHSDPLMASNSSSSSSSRHNLHSIGYRQHSLQLLQTHLLPQPMPPAAAAAAAAAAAWDISLYRSHQPAVGMQAAALSQTRWKQQQQQSWHRCSSRLLGTALLLITCLNQCHRSLGTSQV
jgi:hypothetical protein